MNDLNPQIQKAKIDIEVRYAETDQMGVVHHSGYLVWFELARTRLCADVGHPYPAIEARGFWLMVSGAQLKYLDGARYGDEVQVTAHVSRAASRVLHFDYEVLRGTELLVSGRTEHVWVDAETRKTCRAPEDLLPLFRSLVPKS